MKIAKSCRCFGVFYPFSSHTSVVYVHWLAWLNLFAWILLSRMISGKELWRLSLSSTVVPEQLSFLPVQHQQGIFSKTMASRQFGPLPAAPPSLCMLCPFLHTSDRAKTVLAHFSLLHWSSVPALPPEDELDQWSHCWRIAAPALPAHGGPWQSWWASSRLGDTGTACRSAQQPPEWEGAPQAGYRNNQSVLLAIARWAGIAVIDDREKAAQLQWQWWRPLEI